MSSLSYPFVFECANCENEITITKDTVRDVFELSEPDFDSLDTINAVLHRRGWMRDDLDHMIWYHMIWCPGCAGVEAVE